MHNIKKNKYTYDENDRQHGECVVYYDNGRINYSINFVNGIRHGLHEGYNYDGILVYRGYYNMGRRIGYWYLTTKIKYYLCLT